MIFASGTEEGELIKIMLLNVSVLVILTHFHQWYNQSLKLLLCPKIIIDSGYHDFIKWYNEILILEFEFCYVFSKFNEQNPVIKEKIPKTWIISPWVR